MKRRPLACALLLATFLAGCGDAGTPEGAGNAGTGSAGAGNAGAGNAGAGNAGAGNAGAGSAGAGNAGAGNASAGGGSLGTGTIVGSYELTFTTATVSSTMNADAGITPPSTGKKIRLDIRKAGGSYTARFSPPFAESSTLWASVTPGTVTLTGEATVEGPKHRDSWKTLTLGIAADGSLDGTLSAKGQLIAHDDYAIVGTLTGSGSVALDTTPPAFQVSWSSSTGPDVGIFPWSPIVVDASEWVPMGAFEDSLTLHVNGAALPNKTTFISGLEDDVRSATALLSNWDATGELELKIAAGVTDPAGNASAAFSKATPLLPLPKALPNHTLDGEMMTVTPWGKLTILGASDPACEVGGCAKLGLVEQSQCSGADPAGFAGRVTTTGKKSLAVRFRAWGDGMAAGWTSALRIAVFGHDGMSSSVVAYVEEATMQTQPTSIDGMSFASAWNTVTIPLPAGDEVGFTVSTTTNPACVSMGAPTVPLVVLVDRVETQ